MTEAGGATVVRLQAANVALRDHFIGWQCRLRELAMRQAGGRPGEAMRPLATVAGEAAPLGRLTVLLNRLEVHSATAELRHMHARTRDPRERREAGLRFLSSTYFQQSARFSDRLTALFAPGSDAAQRLVAGAHCRLDFAQYNQRYRLHCAVEEAAPGAPLREATYWHNALFNPGLPGDATVLVFDPDWALAEADPPPPGI